MTRKHLVVIVALACSLFLTDSALAEGSWASNIQGALTGFRSRNWTDNNLDAAGTYINFQGCDDGTGQTNPNDNTEVRLWHDVAWAPDDNFGSQTLYCYYSDTKYWGQVPAGNYYFILDRINSSTSGWRINVGYVEVGY